MDCRSEFWVYDFASAHTSKGVFWFSQPHEVATVMHPCLHTNTYLHNSFIERSCKSHPVVHIHVSLVLQEGWEVSKATVLNNNHQWTYVYKKQTPTHKNSVNAQANMKTNSFKLTCTQRMTHTEKQKAMKTQTHTTWLGTGSQEVYHIQVVSNVVKDLQFCHQSLVFTGCGSLWRTKYIRARPVSKWS